ncbi:MAG: amidohydrolase family protein [Candidatus Latescibacteria bacterium]|nr:amidohydrolase family protein [Candidatus Latescibacterota bacterium]
MPKRTRIDAKMIVAYQSGGHRLLRDGCLVIEDRDIAYVGKEYSGPVDEVVNAGDRVVTPGFINTHTHLAGSPLDKSFIEDVGSRQFYLSGLATMLRARAGAMGTAERQACVDYSMAELIRTGTTTVMELGGIGDYVADAVERAGLRAYIADMYSSARWVNLDDKEVGYEWDEAAGLAGFEKALALVERLNGRANGRISGFISPAQIDNCSEDLLRQSRKAADALQVPLALHTSQAVFEFQEMVRRHGMTPVEWLESIDFLGEWCILGHVIFPAGHSWVNFAGDDLAILARHQASVAHATWVFNRRGLAMESFPAYLDAGVNVCLATDTCPQSMIEAMRWSAVVGKIMIRQTEKSTAADAFNAATLNAAKMLHRDDLGRIAAGAKADLLLWDATSTFMVPLRDPIKNIVYNAAAEDLQDVVIDGSWVMRQGRVLNVDEPAANQKLQEAGERVWGAVNPEVAGDIDELSPPAFPSFQV